MHRMRSPLVIGALAALTLAGPALAATRTREVLDLWTPDVEAQIAADLTEWCGFAVAVDVQETLTVTTWSKSDGSLLLETDMYKGKWTITNVLTHVSTVINQTGLDILWLSKNGDLMHALTGHAYYPGLGYFNGYVLVNDTTGEILRKFGKFFGDIQQVICAPLRP